MDKTTKQRVLQALSDRIEEIRSQLNEAAKLEKDNFLSPNIVKLSMDLDKIIVEYEKIKRST